MASPRRVRDRFRQSNGARRGSGRGGSRAQSQSQTLNLSTPVLLKRARMAPFARRSGYPPQPPTPIFDRITKVRQNPNKPAFVFVRLRASFVLPSCSLRAAFVLPPCFLRAPPTPFCLHLRAGYSQFQCFFGEPREPLGGGKPGGFSVRRVPFSRCAESNCDVRMGGLPAKTRSPLSRL
jgi:hypothetical protein